MSRRLHFGNHKLRGVDSVNLNRCSECGTTNPTLPGAGLPERCSGCGTPRKVDQRPAVWRRDADANLRQVERASDIAADRTSLHDTAFSKPRGGRS